jgi:hypothetical protein
VEVGTHAVRPMNALAGLKPGAVDQSHSVRGKGWNRPLVAKESVGTMAASRALGLLLAGPGLDVPAAHLSQGGALRTIDHVARRGP